MLFSAMLQDYIVLCCIMLSIRGICKDIKPKRGNLAAKKKQFEELHIVVAVMLFSWYSRVKSVKNVLHECLCRRRRHVWKEWRYAEKNSSHQRYIRVWPMFHQRFAACYFLSGSSVLPGSDFCFFQSYRISAFLL